MNIPQMSSFKRDAIEAQKGRPVIRPDACPKCGSSLVAFAEKSKIFTCVTCGYMWRKLRECRI